VRIPSSEPALDLAHIPADDSVHRQAGLAPAAIDTASRRICPVCGSELDLSSVNARDGTARCATKGHLVTIKQ